MKPLTVRSYQSRSPVDMPAYKTTQHGVNFTTPLGTIWRYAYTTKNVAVAVDYYEGRYMSERIGFITHDYIMKRPLNFELINEITT